MMTIAYPNVASVLHLAFMADPSITHVMSLLDTSGASDFQLEVSFSI